MHGYVSRFIVREQLGIYEGRVLRKILEPLREEFTGGYKKLHIEELNNLCPQDIMITKLKGRGGFVACVGEMRNGL